MENLDKILLNSDSNDQFIRSLMGNLIGATRSSNELPLGEDFQYFSTFPNFTNSVNETGELTVNLIDSVFKFVDPKIDFEFPDDLLDPSLFDQVVEVIDKLLSDADFRLNDVTGKSKLQTFSSPLGMDKSKILLSNVQDIPKPQLKWLREIDNSRERPFRPKITTKPHQLVPLDLTEKQNPMTSTSLPPFHYYPHPYEHELKHLVHSDWQLSDPSYSIPSQSTSTTSSSTSSLPSLSLEEYPFQYVSTEDDLMRVIDEIMNDLDESITSSSTGSSSSSSSPSHRVQGIRELAFDLEHHSVKSFQGFTCLIQMSTREKDYIFDAITLRPYLSALNILTAHPKLVKVFHGCDRDIEWLQKDFGIYVVNCFDTFHAAKFLNYPTLSLAHLLKVHCDVIVNKKHQLSDWRVRPLPSEMIRYAQEDTHSLLTVYDKLRLELYHKLGSEGLGAVLAASNKTCMNRYEKEKFDPLGYRKILEDPRRASVIQSLLSSTSSSSSLNSSSSSMTSSSSITSQLPPLLDSVVRALWDWRDLKARTEDESTPSLMSNSELLRIALKSPSLPPLVSSTTSSSVSASSSSSSSSSSDLILLERCCGPMNGTAKKHATEILSLLRHTLSNPLPTSSLSSSSSNQRKQGDDEEEEEEEEGDMLLLKLYHQSIRRPVRGRGGGGGGGGAGSRGPSSPTNLLPFQPFNQPTVFSFVPSVSSSTSSSSASSSSSSSPSTSPTSSSSSSNSPLPSPSSSFFLNTTNVCFDSISY